MLRYYEELGIDDIAETLGISRNSVKTHLRRGLAALEDAARRAVDDMSVVERAAARAPCSTAGAAALDESDDLFARVRLSIEDDRRTPAPGTPPCSASCACLAGAVAAVVLATTDRRQGELLMDWWILELLTAALLVALALWLGPFIKRFGKSYAADVFRANPRTGKSFIVLTDVAYYLIFFAYILFTVRFEPRRVAGTTR